MRRCRKVSLWLVVALLAGALAGASLSDAVAQSAQGGDWLADQPQEPQAAPRTEGILSEGGPEDGLARPHALVTPVGSPLSRDPELPRHAPPLRTDPLVSLRL
jgi:hypothetical protein